MPAPTAADGVYVGGCSTSTSSSGGNSGGGKDALMAVDLRRLKAEDELKSIFGARVIHAVEVEEGNRGGGGGAHANPHRRRGGAGASSSTSRLKSVLVTPKDNWPPYRRGTGLSMECLGVDRDGAQVFRYVYNADYADAQRAYERAQASHNPNNLIALLRQYPWHVDALLALSDIYIYTAGLLFCFSFLSFFEVAASLFLGFFYPSSPFHAIHRYNMYRATRHELCVHPFSPRKARSDFDGVRARFKKNKGVVRPPSCVRFLFHGS